MSEAPRAQSNVPTYSRRNPFPAELTARWPLTKPGSDKETLHVAVSLKESGLTYTPGDSLGIVPSNPPELVDELVSILELDPGQIIQDRSGTSLTLYEALRTKYILNRATKKFVLDLATHLPQGESRNRAAEIADTDQALSDYIYSRDYIDVLREFPETRFDGADELVGLLSPISPRLYSIASSLRAHPNEAQLCIGIVRWENNGRKKSGLCTGFVADQVQLHQRSVPIYVQESRAFRLPSDRTRDIIMVGPGTGIAPFRAFLEERILNGDTGRNWLFFGEQHRTTDFFYEDEWQAALKRGQLHHLDLAFSRDQPQKIYVQHRLRERARELWDWLQRGAYFYVCGDARRMAKDVHQELINIAQTAGGLAPEAASTYVNETLMRTEGRYLRDVY
jgi:sulfite reductase (NADPH) flavoprotein alpha-component